VRQLVIRWHQGGGPDEESNGFALCVLHHKTFDLGAFTVNGKGAPSTLKVQTTAARSITNRVLPVQKGGNAEQQGSTHWRFFGTVRMGLAIWFSKPRRSWRGSR
jgi:hypothetical protein